MKKKMSFVLVLAMTASIFLSACGNPAPPPAASGGSAAGSSAAASSAAPVTLTMGTGSSGGTYYALGGSMATAMGDTDSSLSITALSTGASVENLNLLNAGELDLGIAMNATAVQAWDGAGSFTAPTQGFRAIGVVYHEVYQIVAAAKTNATKVSDLAGLRVAVGPAGSGTIGCSTLVLDAAGLDMEKDIKPQNDSFGDAATKMQDGQIDVACNVLAVPASSIVEMTTSMDLSYVNISDEELATIQKDAPYYTRYVIPAGTYSNKEDINTITCQAALYCRADLDDDTVYAVTKAFYESADAIAAAHSAGKDISLEGALSGITTPVHPGAARYFEEKGIAVDASLLAS